MGAADPFGWARPTSPAPGIRRFISGTPAVVGMLALRDMVALIEEAGMTAVRDKSVDLTTYAVDLADAWLQPLGVTVGVAPGPGTAGWSRHLQPPAGCVRSPPRCGTSDVLPDYRDPDGLRIGLSPLSTSFDEVRRGMEAVRATLLRIGD